MCIYLTSEDVDEVPPPPPPLMFAMTCTYKTLPAVCTTIRFCYVLYKAPILKKLNKECSTEKTE